MSMKITLIDNCGFRLIVVVSSVTVNLIGVYELKPNSSEGDNKIWKAFFYFV